MSPLTATRLPVSSATRCGSAPVPLSHAVALSPSSTRAAVDCPLSAVTVQPVRGSGNGVVTATGTARGMMCPACGSGAAGAAAGAGRCSATAAPAIRHMTRAAAVLAHHPPWIRMFVPPDRSRENHIASVDVRLSPSGQSGVVRWVFPVLLTGRPGGRHTIGRETPDKDGNG
ncbi:hypothetical protein GCM10010168_62050 [Actinoplanes ianthinogenes]|uniref:Uncharacterized protein n=1 Tax=Actinoplanes ianthinogenes TaxID=122358 RepID=A0ABM7M4J4_9ACTN|nr:hypothetical protein Aiant_72230 [Actinoplanes ianthinogenes]GGR35147.1 hypothetical protein GCM10010168_62050 [Actinoplanes ianthinogenes]